MLNNIFITAAIAGVLTVSMTDAFATVKDAAMNVVGVYDAAREINPWEDPYKNYKSQRMALYKAAGKLEGFAGSVVELQFDENGQIINSAVHTDQNI